MLVDESILPQLVQTTLILLVMPLTVFTLQFRPSDCPTVGVLERVTVMVGGGTKRYTPQVLT